MCVVPVEVVDVLDVAEQRAFILGTQSQPRLVTDTLQVVLQRDREKAAMMELYCTWLPSWHTHTHT